MMPKESWETYEEVATYLLNSFATHFNLDGVEGKQKVAGECRSWQIDGKGYCENNEGFIIIECKRYTKDKNITPETMAGLAFRIQDTGAAGGIVVTPVDFQKGAKQIADKKNITKVYLHENSTTTGYILKFLNDIFVGVSDEISLTDSIRITYLD